MRFRLTSMLLSITVVCLVLGAGVTAEKIPPGAFAAALAPVGLAIAVLIAVWRNVQTPTKVVLAVLFAIGWSYLVVYVEVVLATIRSADSSDRAFAGPLLFSLVGLFAGPAIVLCMLLLRSWLWAWHDRFG